MGYSNEHNSNLAKINWTTPEEIAAVISYARDHYSNNDFFLRDGYRRLTYRMLDEDVAAISPSTVYRILKKEGLLNMWRTGKTSSKGDGFKQPTAPHQHWHTDIKYMNLRGSFVFLISVMDGYSRYIVHHEVRNHMTSHDVEITLQRAKEKHPDKKPKLISDNGSQFIAKDFKEFIKNIELTHAKTSVAYPQSNGKLERFHRSISMECLNIKSFLSIEDVRTTVAKYVDHYNKVRLHSSLNYLTPEDYLLNRQDEKIKIRERKLMQASLKRKNYWSKNAA